jgi:hypothetical protein
MASIEFTGNELEKYEQASLKDNVFNNFICLVKVRQSFIQQAIAL